jgi:hypothetical protein
MVGSTRLVIPKTIKHLFFGISHSGQIPDMVARILSKLVSI